MRLFWINATFIEYDVYFQQTTMYDEARQGDDTMSDTNTLVGQRLRELRESRGFSLEYVGNIIHRSRKTVWDYEQGRISISLNVLKSILAIYDVNVGRFLDEVDR